MATVLKADGTDEALVGEGLRGELTLGQMQKAVGGPIEPVYDLVGTRRTRLLANEEGMIRGLPINPRATEVAHECGYRQFIHGDVVLIERVEVVKGEGEIWF